MRAAVLAAEVIEEVIDQEIDVAAAFAQRRDEKLEDAEAIVEIFAEFFLTDVGLQVLIGGGDDADVGRDFLRTADGEEGMAFENTKELGLAFHGHFADFVEEERSAVGLLEEAGVVAVGAGEGASFVAEELAFHKLGGNGGAIDAEHGAIGTGAGFVDGPGDELFAGAAFAAE